MVSSTLFALLIFYLASIHAEIVYEGGYTVNTALDGHKLGINPHAVLPRRSSSDLVLLDSANSVFYSVSFPISQESAIKRFSGNGSSGYSDGKAGSDTVMFNKPRSFAVDSRGNVYVADKLKRTIRKITSSGVTTIAGGYSKKPGRGDGPAQSASFSDDFELAFVPEICALLISDHGNRLVRQINLKTEDCHTHSGAAPVWDFGVGHAPSFLTGLIIGIAICSYVIPRRGTFQRTSFPRHMEALIQLLRTLCSVINSTVASSTCVPFLLKLFQLSQSILSLMFGLTLGKYQTSHDKPVSLLESDDANSYVMSKPQLYADLSKDLLSSDGSLELSNPNNEVQGPEINERNLAFPLNADHLKDLSSSGGSLELSNPTNEVQGSETDERNLALSSYADQLKDLFRSDGSLELSNPNNEVQGPETDERNFAFCDTNGKIDAMVRRNLVGFANAAGAKS